jgi:hypothetical protein
MRRATLFGVIQIALGLSLSGVSHASYVVNLTESGGNVVATGSGTINTAGLNYAGPGYWTPMISGAQDFIVLGAGGSIDDYNNILTGPSSFGSGTNFGADDGGGDLVGYFTGGSLFVPLNYVSGTSLDSNATWTGQTFASLGLTPGSYVWTWGSGANADSFTLNIGAQTVPEPASLFLLGMGSLAIFGYARQRRHAAA